MKNTLLITVVLFFAATFNTNAAPINIKIDSAEMTAQEINLQAFWAALATSDITEEGVFLSPTNVLFAGGNANNDKIFRLSVIFNTVNDLSVDFLAGLDAGFGAELFANGVNVLDKTNDIWWQLDWDNNAVISKSFEFGAGTNELVLYWAEGFNSGGNQFNITAKVSAPGVLSIFLLGFAGLVLSRRK